VAHEDANPHATTPCVLTGRFILHCR
jgi:hypothetical protein